jgi:sterol desaturase/sphingolipid hydroxylase (fatty acid hydroxylase superfamily)
MRAAFASFHFGTYLLLVCLFVALEALVPLAVTQRRARRGWTTDVAFLVVNTLLFASFLGVVIAAIGLAGRALIPNVAVHVGSWPLWIQSILAIAIGDLGTYLAHRTEHAIPALWRFHSVHHGAEEMDFLVAQRNHPVDLFIQKAGALVPVLALGFSPAAIAVYTTVYMWQSYLAHANVRLSYGPLRWILVSLEFHHWHHAEEREAYDTNFAGLCAFWDVLFRTAHLPNGRLPSRYGLNEDLPRSLPGLLGHPFRTRRSTAPTAPSHAVD